MSDYKKPLKCELYNDNFQNYKRYNIPKAQLVVCDIPYNIGTNFYGSNPSWYVGGDNANGESNKAGKAAFNTDFTFNIEEYFHFCSRLLKPEDKKPCVRGKSTNSPCMIVFCSFEQTAQVIEVAKKHGFVHNIPLVFVKNYSAQALKANMRIVGATEYALVLYRDRLPKFRNDKVIDKNGVEHGKMVFNWMAWEKDGKNIPKLHPTQKPQNILRALIKTFTDEGDVVIDPCAGSGSTLRAAHDLGRSSYGFEVSKPQYKKTMESTMLQFDSLFETAGGET